MQMRKELKGKNIPTSKYESYIVHLLFDPAIKDNRKQKLQIALLLIPVLIFISSLVITLLIDFHFDKPTTESDNPFRAAVGLNVLIYTTISIFAIILMSLSLWKLFHASNKPPVS
jgi:hypothetical protein